jgi:hypothetical protein
VRKPSQMLCKRLANENAGLTSNLPRSSPVGDVVSLSPSPSHPFVVVLCLTHSMAHALNYIIVLLHLLLSALPSVLPISGLLETDPTITTNVGLHVDTTSILGRRMVPVLSCVLTSSLYMHAPS